MASVTVDSELMTNYISAVPLAAGAEFRTVLDNNRRPMVFCLSSGTEPQIQLCKCGCEQQARLADVSASKARRRRKVRDLDIEHCIWGALECCGADFPRQAIVVAVPLHVHCLAREDQHWLVRYYRAQTFSTRCACRYCTIASFYRRGGTDWAGAEDLHGSSERPHNVSRCITLTTTVASQR